MGKKSKKGKSRGAGGANKTTQRPKTAAAGQQGRSRSGGSNGNVVAMETTTGTTASSVASVTSREKNLSPITTLNVNASGGDGVGYTAIGDTGSGFRNSDHLFAGITAATAAAGATKKDPSSNTSLDLGDDAVLDVDEPIKKEEETESVTSATTAAAALSLLGSSSKSTAAAADAGVKIVAAAVAEAKKAAASTATSTVEKVTTNQHVQDAKLVAEEKDPTQDVVADAFQSTKQEAVENKATAAVAETFMDEKNAAGAAAEEMATPVPTMLKSAKDAVPIIMPVVVQMVAPPIVRAAKQGDVVALQDAAKKEVSPSVMNVVKEAAPDVVKALQDAAAAAAPPNATEEATAKDISAPRSIPCLMKQEEETTCVADVTKEIVVSKVAAEDKVPEQKQSKPEPKVPDDKVEATLATASAVVKKAVPPSLTAPAPQEAASGAFDCNACAIL